MRAFAHRYGSSAFTLAVVVFMIAVVWTANGFSSQARFFPRAIGIPALFLALIQLTMEVVRARRLPADGSGAFDEEIVDLAVDRDIPLAIVVRRGGALALWILGYFVGILLFGFVIASPIFVLLYLTFRAHASIPIVTLCVSLIIVLQIGVFDRVLHLPWLKGVFPGPQEQILKWLT